MTLSTMALDVECCYTECRYAECRDSVFISYYAESLFIYYYAECRYAQCRGAPVDTT
jgi:hypothetical protein